MAQVKIIKRLANPRPVSRRARPSRRSVSSVSSRVSGLGVRQVTRKRKTVTRRKATRNPAVLVTLGAVNPHKGPTTVATRKRRTRRRNPLVRRTRTRRARRRNSATRIVVMAPRKRTSRRRYGRRRNPSIRIRRRRAYGRRRNPQLLGMSVSGAQAVKLIVGGLAGVAITKTLTTMLPPMLLSSGILRIVSSGAIAFISGMLVGRIDSTFGSAVAFGGYMQTGSVALNAFVPTIGSRLSLGDLVPGSFPVPQNPIMAGYLPPAPANARVTTSGLTRAFGSAAL